MLIKDAHIKPLRPYQREVALAVRGNGPRRAAEELQRGWADPLRLHTGEIVRGRPARWSHNDPRPCRIPPDWSKQGYVSIYAAQKHETVARAS